MKKTKQTIEWNKVTPITKYLAMTLFVALPFIGFILGIKYERNLGLVPTRIKMIDEKNPTSTPFGSPSTKAPKEADTSACTDNYMKISLDPPPTSKWKCSKPRSTEEEINSKIGWISISSDLFTINISDTGRGPYCGDGNDPECTTAPFLNDSKFDLTMFTYKGEDKEIFGSIKSTTHPWISIKYKNMETQKLTSIQRKELLELLNSIKLLP